MGVNAGPETTMSAKLVESLIELCLIHRADLRRYQAHSPLVSTRVKVQSPLVQRKDDMIAFEGMCAKECCLKSVSTKFKK
jgi:hypothetical protein